MLPGQGTRVICTGVYRLFANVEVLGDHFMLHDRSCELQLVPVGLLKLTKAFPRRVESEPATRGGGGRHAVR